MTVLHRQNPHPPLRLTWSRHIVPLIFLAGALECAAPPEPFEKNELSASAPSGFTDTAVATGLNSPTAMAIAPDDRIFVCEQGGGLRIIKNGSLLATPFVTVPTTANGERGLLGVAFDPGFVSNGFVYLYYTSNTPAIHNRVSRFTANGDTASMSSEVVILEIENLSGATNHNGGAMHFGRDGKLYVAVGENANSANSQTLTNRLGKILRLNADGTIPTDNPFYGSATGVNRSIWAMGLRNPFTFAFQPGTGRMFIDDVGQDTWEEIDDGVAGSNYGWPTTEGSTSDSRFRSPVFAYGHGSTDTTGCAITGGTFYNPTTSQFPSTYAGKYFFADYCGNWIRLFDPASGTAQGFASAIAAPVDLAVGSNGSLYYLARGASSPAGMVGKITYVGNQQQAPAITTQPQSQTRAVGQTATFAVTATGSAPLSYQWRRGGSNISGATAASYSFAVASTDNGASFDVIVTNAVGSVTSTVARLTVSAASTPMGTISTPASGTTYAGGDTISYSGTATDATDGSLPASAFTWQVEFHHDSHIHPFVPPTSGSKTGSFVVPKQGETASTVYYRIILTVKNSSGVTDTRFVDVVPRTSKVTLSSNPTGLQLLLDGQPVTSPYSFVGVVGITRTIGATSPQSLNGKNAVFSSWSDGRSQTHDVDTPAVDTTFTATFDSACRNQAMTFDGVNDLVNIPDLSLTGDFTVEAWVKLNPGIDNADGIVGPEGGGGADLNFYGEKLRLYTGSGDAVVANTRIAAGVWTHYAVTRQGGGLTLYVNGRADATGSWAGTFIVRALGRGNAGFLAGQLDEVRIWSVARSAADVSGYYLKTVPPSSPGLAAYYGFNEADGSQTVINGAAVGMDGSLGQSTGLGGDDPVRVAATAPVDFSAECGSGSGAPTANAGPDQSVTTGQAVTLNGSASSNPGGGTLTYVWTQTAGPSVMLAGNTTATPGFTAPGVSATLTFRLTVSNGTLQSTDDVLVTVTASGTCQSRAMSFDGVNDFVNIPDLSLTGDFTVEAWAKLNSGIDNTDGIVGPEASHGADLNFYGEKLRLYTGTTDAVVANTKTTAAVWTHYAVTRQGGALTLYVNGKADATGSWTGTFPIRAIGSSNAGFLAGQLDEVRIWNLARSAAAISGSYLKTVAPSTPGLLAYYGFNEADGNQTVISAASSGMNGSLGQSASVASDDPTRLAATAPVDFSGECGP